MTCLKQERRGVGDFHMIRTISVGNFRCYKSLLLDGLSRLNVIVGDNGSGKTALLEALFMTLATSTEVGLRLRQQRGLDSSFAGPIRRVEQAIWGDYFYNSDWTNAIRIVLSGDGPEARTLEITKGTPEAKLPLAPGDLSQLVASAPVTFTWTDAEGQPHSVTPTISSAGGLTLPETGEDMQRFYYISAGTPIGSVESASRFSDLSKVNRHQQFVDLFTREYNWIENLDVEVLAGSPAIFATIKGSGRKMPLANVSAGMSRLMAIMLSISAQRRTVVLVDEIENGIFHTHLTPMWRAILLLLEEYESQLFVSTHSQECIKALGKAVANKTQLVTLLRTEKDLEGSRIASFPGKTFMAGVKYGEEVR